MINTLDVGCGYSHKGDVNLDIRRSCKPEIIASVNALPFRDNAFDKLFCYHVLEHFGVKPIKAIGELLRVSRDLVEIEVPHWLSSKHSHRTDDSGVWFKHTNTDVMHRTFWTAFNPVFLRTNFTYLKLFFLLARPFSLTVTLRKKKRGGISEADASMRS